MIRKKNFGCKPDQNIYFYSVMGMAGWQLSPYTSGAFYLPPMGNCIAFVLRLGVHQPEHSQFGHFPLLFVLSNIGFGFAFDPRFLLFHRSSHLREPVLRVLDIYFVTKYLHA